MEFIKAFLWLSRRVISLSKSNISHRAVLPELDIINLLKQSVLIAN